MAHLKRYGPKLNGNIEKVEKFVKIGVPAPSEVSLSRIVSPQKAVFRAFFLENHFFDPFRPNEDPQVLYMAGKLWISSLWWYKEKNIFLHPVERMIFYDGPHRYFPLYWEAVIYVFLCVHYRFVVQHLFTFCSAMCSIIAAVQFYCTLFVKYLLLFVAWITCITWFSLSCIEHLVVIWSNMLRVFVAILDIHFCVCFLFANICLIWFLS